MHFYVLPKLLCKEPKPLCSTKFGSLLCGSNGIHYKYTFMYFQSYPIKNQSPCAIPNLVVWCILVIPRPIYTVPKPLYSTFFVFKGTKASLYFTKAYTCGTKVFAQYQNYSLYSTKTFLFIIKAFAKYIILVLHYNLW